MSAVTISVLTLSLIPVNMAFADEPTYTYATAPTTITAKSKNAVIGVQNTEALVIRSTTAVPSDSRVGLYDTDSGKLLNGDRFLSTSNSELSFNDYIPSGTHHSDRNYCW